MYSSEPEHPAAYRDRFDAFYSRFAGVYDRLLSLFPTWNRWNASVLSHVRGPRTLEVSFGTGHLLTQLSASSKAFGIDFNRALARQAAARLARAGRSAEIVVADVEHIPFPEAAFDSVVCTMAFSGFARGEPALRQMRRVLKRGGRLALVDFSFPRDGRPLGMLITRLWQAAGDVIRDLPALFASIGWHCDDQEIGAFGSVHLYLAEK